MLADYFPDFQLSDHATLYTQHCGGIRPHKDASLDGRSNYTLLVYMEDEYDGGQTNLKVKRTQYDIEMDGQPDKLHKVMEITPKIGYGLIFNKSILHFAKEVYGKKTILLLHFFSTY